MSTHIYKLSGGAWGRLILMTDNFVHKNFPQKWSIYVKTLSAICASFVRFNRLGELANSLWLLRLLRIPNGSQWTSLFSFQAAILVYLNQTHQELVGRAPKRGEDHYIDRTTRQQSSGGMLYVPDERAVSCLFSPIFFPRWYSFPFSLISNAPRPRPLTTVLQTIGTSLKGRVHLVSCYLLTLSAWQCSQHCSQNR